MSYDVEKVRLDFPILQRKIHGKPLVFLDSAASAQKPMAVLDAMHNLQITSYANVHRGLYTLAQEATAAFEAARQAVQSFLNAPEPETVIFTRSATAALNVVASGLGQTHLREGDEIVLSVMEHHANIIPWHFLRERYGAVLRWVPVLEDGSLDMEAFRSSLSEKTKIVAMTHMSNVLGTRTPLKEIVRFAHDVGAVVVADGSQAAVHGRVDVQALGVDFYVFTGHKLYGPTGIGVLYGRRELLEALPPFEGGGEMIDVVRQDKVTYAPLPARLEAGTPPIVEAVGLHAALSYLNMLGFGNIEAHEQDLLGYAQERFGAFHDMKILGCAADKGPLITVAHAHIHAHDLASVLDRYGVAVRAGTHCAQPLLQSMGLTSSCRMSLGIYNTRQDVDVFFDALERAQRLFS